MNDETNLPLDLPTEDIEDVGLKRTNPALVNAAKSMFKELQDQGYAPIVTGGWRSIEHNAEVNGVPNSKHTTGNALDLYCECPDGTLEEMAERHGLTGFWHDAGTGMHFHLQTDDEAEHRFISGFHDMMKRVGDKATNYVYADLPDMESEINQEDLTPEAFPGLLTHMATNFWDSMVTTAPAMVAESLWGKITHSESAFGNLYQPITDDDITYVKEALAGDTEAQEFCLLHGHDAKEIRFLVNQKLVDKKRRRDIERWRENTDSVLQKSVSYLAGGAGMLLDPMMWLPLGSAYNGSKLLTRLGVEAFENVPKAVRLAAKAAEMGAEQTGVTMMEDLVRVSNGENIDWGIHAGAAFLGGALAAKLGGFYKPAAEKLETMGIEGALNVPKPNFIPIGFRKDIGEKTFKDISHILKKEMADTKSPLSALKDALKTDDPMAVLQKAVTDGTVPKAILNRVSRALTVAAKKEGKTVRLTADDALTYLKRQDLTRTQVPIAKVESETHTAALALHDMAFVEKSGSKALETLSAKGRVIATTAEEASAFVRHMSGKELPKNAKAFYVPNEDYAFLLTDRVASEKIDSVLAHEFAVHAGLKAAIGEAAYDRLMRSVLARMNREGDIFHTVRNQLGTQDSEEVLAKLIEDDLLPSPLLKKIQKLLGKKDITLDRDSVKNLLRQQLDRERERVTGVHFNEDGTTAFAGIQFSKDSHLNPNLWHDVYMLEKNVAEITQSDLKHIGEAGRAAAQWLDETTYFGRAFNSLSNTARRLAPRLFDDPRGRGIGAPTSMCAETHKLRIQRVLSKYYLDYVRLRGEALGSVTSALRESRCRAFDKAVVDRYNVKYGKNSAALLEDVPKEVEKACDLLHALREKQIEIGKRSSRMIGSESEDLIEEAWYPVSHELWRQVNPRLKNQLTYRYTDIKNLRDDLIRYGKRYAKRGEIKEMIERDRKLAYLREKKAHPDANIQKPAAVLEEDIDTYIEEEAAHFAESLTTGDASSFDIISEHAVKGADLGDLNFFRRRLPMDTSGIMTFGEKGNSFSFSFDSCLRSYDLDAIIQHNINRFSGEAALKATFGSQNAFQKAITDIEKELTAAVSHGKLNASQKEATLKNLTDAIYELRGMRPKADIMSRIGALGHGLLNLAYLKNGANMIWNQMAEVSGTMAYGGVKQLCAVFSPIADFVENCARGRVSAETIRRIEANVFGQNLEAKIWSISHGDRVTREALTADGIQNTLIRGANDLAATGAKVTSSINMLPKMTDSMTRHMRGASILDTLDWAFGKEVGSFFRKPFSKAKLKAANINTNDAEGIKTALRKYAKRNTHGDYTDLDFARWEREDPITFSKWYNYVEQQADRAIVNGSKIGGRNILKSQNVFTRMLFQFKDYTLRAINGQSLRVLTAGDMDDFMSTGLSIVTNTMAYAARAAAIYEAMKAAGLDEKAEDYHARMFSDGALLRAAAFRSTVVGSPFSLFNDAYEILTGEPSIRSSVEDDTRRSKTFGQRSASDIWGDFLTQLPAIKEATVIPYQFGIAVHNAMTTEATERDAKNMLKLLPIPNLIPFTVGLEKLTESLDLPMKRRNTRHRGKNWRNSTP